MRLGRAAFWRLFFLNIAIGALLVALLPRGLNQPLPPVHGFAMPPLPLKYIVAYLACLPAGWLGTMRLHDVGKAGWHAWLPLIAFACVTFGMDLSRPLLLEAVIWAQAHPDAMRDRHLGMVVMIGLWLGALLLAAGSLRTAFLWLQPGEAKDNRYGPVPERTAMPAPVTTTAPAGRLAGRLGRWPFLALLAGNIALVYGAMYFMDHWPGLKPVNPILRSLAGTLLYLPAFIAAVPRLHDRDQSAILPVLVLLLGLATPFIAPFLDHTQVNAMNMAVNVVTIYLLFQCWQPGDAGANRYGPPPGSAPDAAEPAPRTVSANPVARPATRQGFGRRGV